MSYDYKYLLYLNNDKKYKLYEHINDFPLGLKTFIRVHFSDFNIKSRFDDIGSAIIEITTRLKDTRISLKIREILIDMLHSPFYNYESIRHLFVSCNNIIHEIDKLDYKKDILELIILEIIPFKFEGLQLYLNHGNNVIDGNHDDEYFMTLIACINSYITGKNCYKDTEFAALIFLLFDKFQLDPTKYAHVYITYLSMTDMGGISLQSELQKYFNKDMIYVISQIPDDILNYTGIALKKQAKKRYSRHEFKSFQLKILSESYTNYQVFGDDIFECKNLSDLYKIRSLEENINEYVDIDTDFTISENALSFLKYQYKNNKHAIIRNRNQNSTRHIFEYDGQNYLLFESSNCPNEILGISLKKENNERNLIRFEMDSASYGFVIGGVLK